MAKTVLIVDDVAFVRHTLRDIFQEAGFLVVGEACDGIEAIQQYEKLRPDLVTMDLVMPKLSGIDATRQIVKINGAARVLIISAMGQESLVMEGVNAGARDFLLKPFTAMDVIRAAQHVLQENTPAGRQAANQAKQN